MPKKFMFLVVALLLGLIVAAPVSAGSYQYTTTITCHTGGDGVLTPRISYSTDVRVLVETAPNGTVTRKSIVNISNTRHSVYGVQVGIVYENVNANAWAVGADRVGLSVSYTERRRVWIPPFFIEWTWQSFSRSASCYMPV